MLPITVVLGAAIAVVLLSRILRVGRRPKNYPPGPPTWPILGNIHQVCDKVLPNERHCTNFPSLDALSRCSSPIRKMGS